MCPSKVPALVTPCSHPVDLESLPHGAFPPGFFLAVFPTTGSGKGKPNAKEAGTQRKESSLLLSPLSGPSIPRPV